MMQIKSEIHNTIVISPEAVVLLVTVLLSVVFPNPFFEIGSKLLSDGEAYRYLAGIPVALFLWALKTSKEIFFPSKESNQYLLTWPDYWRLKLRVHIGLVVLFIFAAIPVAGIFLTKGLISARVIGSAFLISVAVGLTTAVTFYLAANRVRELTEGFTGAGEESDYED